MAYETPLSEQVNSVTINLKKHSWELENTRLIYRAIVLLSDNDIGILDNKLAEYDNIIAYNQYTGWNCDDLTTAAGINWTIPYNNPLVFAGLGTGSTQGLHSTNDEFWMEEDQE